MDVVSSLSNTETAMQTSNDQTLLITLFSEILCNLNAFWVICNLYRLISRILFAFSTTLNCAEAHDRGCIICAYAKPDGNSTPFGFSSGPMLKCDTRVHTRERCKCTCAGAARVHCIPWWYVDIKVQVRTLASLRNQTWSFSTKGPLSKERYFITFFWATHYY